MALSRFLLAPAVMVLASLPALADPAALALGRAFCDAVRAGDESAAEALMTPELQAAIGRLRASDAEYRRAHPDDKPPLGDGLRLTAFPDGLEACTPEAATGQNVDLVYAPGSDPASVWRDRLVLETVPEGGLRVADVLFAPDQTTRFSDWLIEAAAWK